MKVEEKKGQKRPASTWPEPEALALGQREGYTIYGIGCAYLRVSTLFIEPAHTWISSRPREWITRASQCLLVSKRARSFRTTRGLAVPESWDSLQGFWVKPKNVHFQRVPS